MRVAVWLVTLLVVVLASGWLAAADALPWVVVVGAAALGGVVLAGAEVLERRRRARRPGSPSS